MTRMMMANVLLLVLVGCASTHQQEYKDATAEARAYLMRLTGDRFDEVVEDNNLYPLFDLEASYHATLLAARRAVRWRIEVAGGKMESGSLNLAMTLSGLLGRKPRVDNDE